VTGQAVNKEGITSSFYTKEKKNQKKRTELLRLN